MQANRDLGYTHEECNDKKTILVCVLFIALGSTGVSAAPTSCHPSGLACVQPILTYNDAACPDAVATVLTESLCHRATSTVHFFSLPTSTGTAIITVDLDLGDDSEEETCITDALGACTATARSSAYEKGVIVCAAAKGEIMPVYWTHTDTDCADPF